MEQTNTIDELLGQAGEAAQHGNWAMALSALERALLVTPADIAVLSAAGTCLIQLERPADAVGHFATAAALAPDSAGAHCNLGTAHMLAGNYQAAWRAFNQAVELEPENLPAWKNLAAVAMHAGDYAAAAPLLAAIVQVEPQDAEVLFMLGQCYELAQDIVSARTMYTTALKHAPQHTLAQESLARLAETAPQPAPPSAPEVARLARPEHAAKLAALKNLARQKTAPVPGNGSKGAQPAASLAAVFYGAPEAATEIRLGAPVRAFAARGIPVKVGLRLSEQDLAQASTFVLANPHGEAELVAAWQSLQAAGRRLILDLDRDFFQLPPGYPGYTQAGPGNPAALEQLTAMLAAAQLVSVPCNALAEVYRPYAPRVEVVPYAWSQDNPLWAKPAPPRQTFNLGLVGLHTTPQDLVVLHRAVEQFLSETPQGLLVVIGDLALYNAFPTLGDEQKMFLPPGRLEDYPYLLAQVDVLLLPLAANVYNRSKPPLPLLEAGVRGIPWVATPVPSFEEWGVGGMFAGDEADWHVHLQALSSDRDLVQELGAVGNQKAADFEETSVSSQWQRLLAER